MDTFSVNVKVDLYSATQYIGTYSSGYISCSGSVTIIIKIDVATHCHFPERVVSTDLLPVRFDIDLSEWIAERREQQGFRQRCTQLCVLFRAHPQQPQERIRWTVENICFQKGVHAAISFY